MNLDALLRIFYFNVYEFEVYDLFSCPQTRILRGIAIDMFGLTPFMNTCINGHKYVVKFWFAVQNVKSKRENCISLYLALQNVRSFNHFYDVIYMLTFNEEIFSMMVMYVWASLRTVKQ